MGLISKIEDKLSGSSSEQNKLEKQNQDTGSSSSMNGATSKLQHPISGSDGRPHGSEVGSASRMPGGYDDSSSDPSGNYGRGTSDNYGSSNSGNYDRGTSNKYDRGTSNKYDRGTSNRYDRDTSDAYGGHQTGSGMSSSTMPSSATSGTKSGYSGPQQPYDPYSSKGQQRAADAVTGGSSGTSRSQAQNFSRNNYDDSSVARSKHGGIVNQNEDPRYTSGTTGGQSYDNSSGTTSGSQPTSTPHHHYGRDAALAGGLGAGGVGAYEMGRSHDHNTTSQNPSSSRYTSGNTNQPQDVSYMNQSADAAPISSADQYAGRSSTEKPDMAGSTASMGTAGTSSTTGGGSSEHPGLSQARKMGGAYEAGYRDAMEHMKSEMGGMSVSK